MKTNITNPNNTIVMPEKLTVSERKKLKRIVTGYRNMKIAVVRIKELGYHIDRSTIYRAIAGMNIDPETAEKLRALLNQ